MKIVYPANSFIPSRMASSVHVMRQCQSFAALGHDVTLVVPHNPSKVEPNVSDIFAFYGVRPIFNIVRQQRFALGLTALAIVWKMIRQQPDLIYGRHPILCTAAALLGKPTVLELHEPSDKKWFIHFAVWLLSWLPTGKGLVVISDRLRQRTEQLTPRFKGRILVAHDGADPITLPKPIALKPSRGFHVGYTGQLYAGKGMETISELAALCPWATFHIVGGTVGDIDAWQKATADKKNIVFHGFKTQAELPKLLAAFDVVLAPYRSTVYGYAAKNNLADWMSPLKLFEYMAAEKAIICSDLPVIREILTDKKTALLCAPENPASWQKALELLRDNAALRQKISRNAKQVFMANYTWQQRAQKILNAPFIRRPYLFITDNLAQGGAQRVFITLVSLFRAHGLNTNFAILRSHQLHFSQAFAALKPTVLTHSKYPYTGAIWCLITTYIYLWKTRPRIVVSTQMVSNFVAIIAGRLMFCWRPRIVIREANTLSVRAKALGKTARLLHYLAKLIYPRADIILAPSHGVAEDLINHVGVPPSKVRIIANPTVTDELKQQLGLPIEHKFIGKNYDLFVAAGRLSRAKGFDTLIEAFAHVYKKNKNARLLILGEGDTREKLNKQCQKLGISKAVDMPGFVENPFPYMHAAKVFVLSSRWEGLPNVLIQAIACGATPVSTRCPSGPEEILKNGKYGYLVPVDDAPALATAMQQGLRKPISKKLLQACAQQYDENAIFKNYLNLLEGL